MAIASPSERVYYYECSNGRFRLVHFIPPVELRRLRRKKLISPEAIKDFPDGVDLGCTDPDFTGFEKAYGYRPPLDPDALRHAFFAILSTTRDWENLSASGFIPAPDLESHLADVSGALRKEKIRRVARARPDKLTLRQRRQRRRQLTTQQKQTYDVLRELPVRGIDPERTLPQQQFSRVKLEDGTGAEEVFIRLHQKHREGE
jgi:hypothetical protein